MQFQQRSANSADPIRAQRNHHQPCVKLRGDDSQHAAGAGQGDALAQENLANCARREAKRSQHADLAGTLLNTQLEEQSGEHQRGNDQEETKVDEVLAEIGGALGSIETLRAYRIDGHARARRIDDLAQARFDIRLRGYADGSKVAEARSPEGLSLF